MLLVSPAGGLVVNALLFLPLIDLAHARAVHRAPARRCARPRAAEPPLDGGIQPDTRGERQPGDYGDGRARWGDVAAGRQRVSGADAGLCARPRHGRRRFRVHHVVGGECGRGVLRRDHPGRHGAAATERRRDHHGGAVVCQYHGLRTGAKELCSGGSDAVRRRHAEPGVLRNGAGAGAVAGAARSSAAGSSGCSTWRGWGCGWAAA